AASTPVVNGAASGGAVSGDFNGDGKLDIATLNAAGAININVLLGNGDGTFMAKAGAYAGSSGLVPTSLAVGDMDNNGALDLVAIIGGKGNGNTATAAPKVLVLLGQKDGSFVAQAGGAVALTASSTPMAIKVGMADNKAKPYVAVVGSTGGKASLDVLTN